MLLTEQVHKNIRKFRELKNITREEMASYMEMSHSGYAKIEQGTVDISIRKLEQIAEIMEVDVQQILQFDVNEIFLNSKQPHISNHRVKKNEELTNSSNDTTYLKKLVESLERENELLRALLASK